VRTFTTLSRATAAVGHGERLIRVRLPAASLYIIVPAHAANEIKIDRLDHDGRCYGDEITV
jgi:hypothetical protein